MTLRSFILALVGAAALFLVARTFAGNPTPPAGPVAGTFKTLEQVEPRIPINSVNTPGDADVTYRITQPGSYYLTENLLGEPGKVGLAIAASDVTVDLGGFALLGQAVGTTAISVTSAGMISLPQDNVVVRNGHIRFWTGDGVFAAFKYGILEDLSIDSIGGVGLNIPAVGALQVRDCRITRCAGDGVYNEGFHTLLERCLIADNNGNGVYSVSPSLTLIRTRVVGNILTGVVASAETSIQDSFIMDNHFGWGVEAYAETHIVGTLIRGNGGANDPQQNAIGGVLAEAPVDIRESNFGRHAAYDIDVHDTASFIADNYFGTDNPWNTRAGGDYSSFFIRNFYRFSPFRIFGQPLDPGIGQLVGPDDVELNDRPHSNYYSAPGTPGQ
jgi:hypothetical protein